MHVFRQSTRTFEPDEYLGIAIGIPNLEHPQQRHVGLIYSDGEYPPRFCHLAWHYTLCDEHLPTEYLWGQSGLDQINKIFMAAYVMQLQQNAQSVPYGISYTTPCFDINGKYISQPIGQGLTCATFILAVFESKGIYLLNRDAWQTRDDDEEWQNQIMDLLSRRASPEHIEAMKSNLGDVRFRTEEVTAGFISDAAPLNFESATEIAAEILNDIYS